jgi:hypothetical protein
MELNKRSSYAEIKKWYLDHWESLPTTLDSECIFYGDVKHTLNVYFHRIESEMKRLGADVKRSAVAKADKNNLITLYNALQDRSKWNVPRHEINPFNNYNGTL